MEIDKSRLKAALEAEKKRKKMGEDEAWQSTKKSKSDVTQEELGELIRCTWASQTLTLSAEAYRLSRRAFEDPMANYQDPEEE